VDFKAKTCKCTAAIDVDGKQKTFEINYDRLILAPGYVAMPYVILRVLISL